MYRVTIYRDNVLIDDFMNDLMSRAVGKAKEKGCRIVERSARACVDADDIVLQPGEKAVIPAIWDRPMDSLLVLIAQPESADFYVEPGIADTKDRKLMVIAGNSTSNSITLSRGQELAQMYAPPEDLPKELIRRDFHPESGAMPEVLRFEKGKIKEIKRTAAEL